jgi:hypothetical protein
MLPHAKRPRTPKSTADGSRPFGPVRSSTALTDRQAGDSPCGILHRERRFILPPNRKVRNFGLDLRAAKDNCHSSMRAICSWALKPLIMNDSESGMPGRTVSSDPQRSCVVGRRGAGKSVLLRVLAGPVGPEHPDIQAYGPIRFEGREVVLGHKPTGAGVVSRGTRSLMNCRRWITCAWHLRNCLAYRVLVPSRHADRREH